MTVMSSHPARSAASKASAAKEPEPRTTTRLFLRSIVPSGHSSPCIFAACTILPRKFGSTRTPRSSRVHWSCVRMPQVTHRKRDRIARSSPVDRSMLSTTKPPSSLRTSTTRVRNRVWASKPKSRANSSSWRVVVVIRGSSDRVVEWSVGRWARVNLNTIRVPCLARPRLGFWRARPGSPCSPGATCSWAQRPERGSGVV